MPSKRAQFKARIKQRQEDAAWRQERSDKLTVQQKLEELSRRPGECKKERERLLALRDVELALDSTMRVSS